MRVNRINHVAVTNWSSRSDRDIAFDVEGLRLAVIEFCAAWGLPVPNVSFFPRDVELPSSEAIIVSAVDNDGNPSTLGFHTQLGGVPTFLWEVGAGTWVAFHEVLETLANPQLDHWHLGPDGAMWWREVCDPTQSDWYKLDVELFGEKRTLNAANWVKPAFFGLPNHDGTTSADKMGVCTPWTVNPGGYAVRTIDGQRADFGARGAAKGCSTSRSAQCPVQG